MPRLNALLQSSCAEWLGWFLQESVQSVEEPLQDLLDGRARSVEYSGGQVIVDAPRRGRAYLPGSFNPLHEGHK